MRALVTGGGGFIGSHLVDRLLREGHEVRVLDDFSTGRHENLAEARPHAEIVEGDVRNSERVHHAMRGREVVFHEAALPSVPQSVRDPLMSNAIGVIGTLNVLLAARDSGVRRVVFASSCAVYGASAETPKTESSPTLPISPYGVGKAAGEGYCRSFAYAYGLETVALRYFNVFGPRQDQLSEYSAVVPRFAAALLAGRPPTVFGDGRQSRDFTYVADVVEANLLAMSVDGVSGAVMNIGCGSAVTLNTLLERLRAALGSDVEARHEQARAGDIRHSLAAIDLAREKLGYEPAVDLDEGLRRTLAVQAGEREQ